VWPLRKPLRPGRTTSYTSTWPLCITAKNEVYRIQHTWTGSLIFAL
jgi:hypothetical protein